MKKFLALSLTVLMLLLAGCGAQTAAGQTQQAAQTQAPAAAGTDAVPQTGTAETPSEESPSGETPAAPAAAAVEMTDSVEVLGTVWYVASGAAGDTFTVNGQTVDATPVDAAGTLYKWSGTDVAGQTVYGTVNVPYADFYYGELNAATASSATVVDTAAGENETLASYRETGMYDAVTSATPSKWQQQAGTYTQATSSGGQILGIADMGIAVDADLYVNASVLAYLGIDPGTALEGFVTGMTVTDTAPAVYKILYADGTLSAVQAAVTAAQGSFTLSSGGRYGDYELRADNIRVSGTILGVVLVTDSGSYGLCHLENIWGNGRELAFWCFASDKTSAGRYLPYESLVGSTVTEIYYITDSGVADYAGLSIAIGE